MGPCKHRPLFFPFTKSPDAPTLCRQDQLPTCSLSQLASARLVAPHRLVHSALFPHGSRAPHFSGPSRVHGEVPSKFGVLVTLTLARQGPSSWQHHARTTVVAMRSLSLRVRWLSGVLALSCLAAGEAAAARTNFLIILADDVGSGDVGYACITNSTVCPKTPNLDAMAKSDHSVVFHRFYAGAGVSGFLPSPPWVAVPARPFPACNPRGWREASAQGARWSWLPLGRGRCIRTS